jgi:hypothetical protein
MAVVVGAFLIGCAVLMVTGCAGTRSEAPQEEQQGHTEGSNKDQTSSPEATASEEARCEGTRTLKLKDLCKLKFPWRGGFGKNDLLTTNDLPGCPKGGLLSGTDKRDKLDGGEGDDEVRGLGGRDILAGGKGNDVVYGGPGSDDLDDPDEGDDVFYGGDGGDGMGAGEGEDVLYGGDGDDVLTAAHSPGQLDRQRDKLYCGEGKDLYYADKNDYVDSSCEKLDPLAEGGGA